MHESLVTGAGLTVSWLLTLSVHSTVLVATGWCLERVARLAPKTRDVLWKTALVGGLVTATAAVVTGNSVPTPPAAAFAWVQGEATVTLEELPSFPTAARITVEGLPGLPTTARIGDGGGRRVVRVRGHGGDDHMVATSAGPSGTATWTGPVPGGLPEGPQARVPGWLTFLLAGWGMGALLGLAALRRRYVDVRAVAEQLGPPGPRVRAQLERLELAPRAWDVRCGDAIDTPCVLPGGVIALPDRCEREFTDGELRAVLGHEVAHVLRRDVLWACVLRSLTAVLWFQPLLRFGLQRVEAAAELVCDDWSKRRTGDSYGLASSISRIAGWAVEASIHPGVAMAGGPRRRLEERVHRVLHEPIPDAVPRWTAPTLAALLLLPLYWVPAVRPPMPAVQSFDVERAAFFLTDSAGVEVDPPVEGRLQRVVVRRFEEG